MFAGIIIFGDITLTGFKNIDAIINKTIGCK